jgi:hypothetical protein
MYNSDIPTRAELPTTKQLLRSTIIAIVSAAAILVAVVLPSEYNIDPTGIGRALGLAEMGEIKQQLAEEAERDRLMDQQQQPEEQPSATPAPGQQSSLLGQILSGLFISSAHAQEAPAARTDTTTISLKPGEGTEVKLSMNKGAKVKFIWTVEGGVVNFDMHGDGGGEEISYEKGRAVPGAEGVLEASFDGKHGWFWRNRGKADVTVTLKTEGDYTEIKKVM